MGILIALLVMLAIASIAGVFLSLFSHFFAVKENPLKKQVRECLPGINCGACGYRGCDDYAEALAGGGVSPCLCVPGTQKVADQISEILGVEAEPVEDNVAFVVCNGTCEATSKRAKYEGVSSCKAASMVYGGGGMCNFGCLGFGDCAAACPSNAICLADGIARVNTSRCLGCGLCVTKCPKSIIKLVPQNAGTAVICSNKQKGADARKACKNACIGCKKCEKTCPHGAISVKNDLAVIDYDKCTNCHSCVSACPTGCLKSVFFADLPDNIDATDIID